ncbi:MAG: exodeoxyribonuclease VII small subunit [Clostridia bacterium]|nr:exodeoxyribonuclease VII small subunit [Clostridia bacterium]
MSKENKTFEETLGELEKISSKLESQDIPLDEAIELFEKGIKLSKECSDKLENAKQKIEILTSDGGGSDD